MFVRKFLLGLLISFYFAGCSSNKGGIDDRHKTDIYLIKSLGYWPVSLQQHPMQRAYGFITLDSFVVESLRDKDLKLSFDVHPVHFDAHTPELKTLTKTKIPYFVITVDDQGKIWDRKDFILQVKDSNVHREYIDMDLRYPLKPGMKIYVGFTLDGWQEAIIKDPKNFVRRVYVMS